MGWGDSVSSADRTVAATRPPRWKCSKASGHHEHCASAPKPLDVEIAGSERVDELEHVVGEVARTLGRGKRSISFTRPRLLDRASQQPAADRPRGTGSRAVLSSGLRQRSGLRMGTSAHPGATRAPKSTCSPPASCRQCAPLTASSEEGRRSSMRTCFITNAIVAVDRVPGPTACTARPACWPRIPVGPNDPPKENPCRA
jgi:hypothetical protein